MLFLIQTILITTSKIIAHFRKRIEGGSCYSLYSHEGFWRERMEGRKFTGAAISSSSRCTRGGENDISSTEQDDLQQSPRYAPSFPSEILSPPHFQARHCLRSPWLEKKENCSNKKKPSSVIYLLIKEFGSTLWLPGISRSSLPEGLWRPCIHNTISCKKGNSISIILFSYCPQRFNWVDFEKEGNGSRDTPKRLKICLGMELTRPPLDMW